MERMLEVFGPNIQLPPQVNKLLLALATDQPELVDWQALEHKQPIIETYLKDCEDREPQARHAAYLILHQIFDRDLVGYRASNDHFWRYSLRCAIAAEHVGQTILDIEQTAPLFLAGLVHDIGKYGLDETACHQQQQMLDARQNTDWPPSFDEIENRFLHDTHAGLSGALLQAWDLPPEICTYVTNHHAPSSAPEALQHATLAVHLGDMFAMMAGWGTEIDRMAYDIDPLADQHVKKDAQWELNVFPKLLLDIDQQYESFLNACFKAEGGKA